MLCIPSKRLLNRKTQNIIYVGTKAGKNIQKEVQMTIEKLTTTIGELVSIEIDDVSKIDYVKDKNNELTRFVITMENGKKFIVEVIAK